MSYYLGIDAGGTQIRSCLVNEAGEIIASAKAGSGNALRVDSTELTERLYGVLSDTLTQADVASDHVYSCIGWAGSGSSIGQQRCRAILEEIEQRTGLQISLKNDAEIALTAAFPEQAGMILVVGTGSIAYGRDATGHLHRTGGWGPEMDDAGSAHWIGSRGFRAALQQADQRLKGNQLKNLFFSQLQIDLPEDSLQIKFSPHALAQLAPLVQQAADIGDPSAKDILTQATEEHYKLVQATQLKTHSKQLALAGGLFEHSQYFRQALSQRIRQEGLDLEISPQTIPPVYGAVFEAYLQKYPQLNPTFKERICQQS